MMMISNEVWNSYSKKIKFVFKNDFIRVRKRFQSSSKLFQFSSKIFQLSSKIFQLSSEKISNNFENISIEFEQDFNRVRNYFNWVRKYFNWVRKRFHSNPKKQFDFLRKKTIFQFEKSDWNCISKIREFSKMSLMISWIMCMRVDL